MEDIHELVGLMILLLLAILLPMPTVQTNVNVMGIAFKTAYLPCLVVEIDHIGSHSTSPSVTVIQHKRT